MSQTSSALDLFDEKATAVRGFTTVMRGYDKKAVDDYIRDMEHQLSVAKQRYREIQRELTVAQLRTDDTDYGKLGAHTASLLKAAESQASDLIARAHAEAQRAVSAAREQAAKLQREAENRASEHRIAGLEEIRTLRATLAKQTVDELEAAKAETSGLREAADKHRLMIVASAQDQATVVLDAAHAEAQRQQSASEASARALLAKTDHECTALLRAAQHDAETLRNEVRIEVEKVRAELAHERESSLTELAEQQASMRDKITAMLDEAREHSTQMLESMAKASADLRSRHQGTLAEAESIKAAAIAEASATVEKAHADIATHRRDQESELERRADELKREVALLRQRKSALLAQLDNLTTLARTTALQFPDDEDGQSVADIVSAVAAPHDDEPEPNADAESAPTPKSAAKRPSTKPGDKA